MMYRTKRTKAAAILIGAAMIISFFGMEAPASASVANWQKGVDIIPSSTTDLSSASFKQSVQNAANLGVNYIVVVLPLYQTNVNTTDVQTGGNTPTDQSIRDAATFIHSIGLHMLLKFQLIPFDGQWSALINPSDRASWFANYGSMVNHYASLAQSLGIERLCLGTELISMAAESVNASNTANWNKLIAGVRAVYSGGLTYDANWGESGFSDEKDNVQFWNNLDFIGISAYFNLTGDGSVASLIQSWDTWNRTTITPLQQKWGKPILFLEIGYKAIHDSYTHPWMWWETGSPDLAQQANDYQALFQYWDAQPFMQGVGLWNWSSNPNAGGAGDNDYTPQGKDAQAVIKQWFSGGTVASSNPVFTSSASIAPPTPASGTSATVTASITDTGGAVSGTNVDLEIYNAAGTQVFQRVFLNQNFAANGTAQYPAQLTAGAAGSYVVKIGVFNAAWQLLYWGNQVLMFTVGTGQTPPPPGAGTVDVWWPSNGSSVSGVQPFKAMLVNAPVDSYSMSWKVDGGVENPMASNPTDFPHKEASVDVSPWTWSATNSYVVTFSAKNSSGQTIGQSSVTIHVTH